MANLTQTSVYAINKTMYTPAISVGIKSANVKSVKPVRDANGKWIATNDLPASKRAAIYAQLVVEKDESGTTVDNYYVNRTVSAMISALNA